MGLIGNGHYIQYVFQTQTVLFEFLVKCFDLRFYRLKKKNKVRIFYLAFPKPQFNNIFHLGLPHA